MDLEKLSLEDLKELKNQVQKTIRTTKTKSEDYALKLKIDEFNRLYIYYNLNNCEIDIGFIYEDGRCFILSTFGRIIAYEQWRKAGMKTDNSIIEWKEGKYKIDIDSTLKRIDVINGNIYDFEECKTFLSCNDDNIMRFKHNNRPIIF